MCFIFEDLQKASVLQIVITIGVLKLRPISKCPSAHTWSLLLLYLYVNRYDRAVFMC